MIMLMMNGMKTAVTLEFKTATQVVMKMDMKIDDNAMKAAGIPWLKRKALKAALAIAPSSEKETYVVKGNKIIIGTGKDQDVMTLSADGRETLRSSVQSVKTRQQQIRQVSM